MWLRRVEDGVPVELPCAIVVHRGGHLVESTLRCVYVSDKYHGPRSMYAEAWSREAAVSQGPIGGDNRSMAVPNEG
jgi:hypothetical protein